MEQKQFKGTPPSENELRIKALLINRTIYYNGDPRTIVHAYEKKGCCEPFHIVFVIQMPEKFIRIFVELGKENQLLDGLDNPDFKIENLADCIFQSETHL